ncbi:MAG TPA: EAL domain-containing protein [Kofleriaceae bacterium]|nr:EAL domain-containing protein [Kofleriaceae bacterium]
MTSDSGRAGGRPRVLAVEESAEDSERLRAGLGDRYELLVAGSFERGVEILREERNLSAVIASRHAVLAEARVLQPEARRVFLCGDLDPAAMLMAVNGIQAHHIAQKSQVDELAQVLGDLCASYQHDRDHRHSVSELRRLNEELWAKETFLSRTLDDQGRELLSTTAELERVTRDLEVLSYRDALTGLYNHRAFQERLREELARSRRYNKPLSLLYCDIDDFARINAELGYQTGDAVLRRLAEVLTASDSSGRLRESDVAARFGGEEIVILLPETSKEGAAIKAERLRAAVEQAAFPGERSIRISIGLAGFPDDAGTSSDLVRSAERALEVAKSSGRNRVQVSASGGGEEVPTGSHNRGSEGAAVHRHERYTSYHVRLFDIVTSLRRDRSLACLFVDLSQLRDVEREVGPIQHAELYARAGDLLDRLRGDRLRRDDLICRTEDSDGYLCFLASPREAGSPVDLESIAARVEATLERELREAMNPVTREIPRVVVGFSRVLDNPLMRPERLVVRLVGEARRSAVLHRERATQRHKALLQEIILRSMLTAAYQPIVDLTSGMTFGFEALARGPRDSTLEAPTALFSVADEVDLTFELDRACFRSALAGAVGLEPVHRLFVNLLPTSFYDNSFIESEVSNLLQAAALTPANVVFEITERLAIENFASFRQALASYTRIGFGVAIDDVGTRHSNLETVMALRPHFVKLSDVLTRGVSKSTVKREMVRSLQRIAEAIDAVIVAEGIETVDDLSVLCDLGVRYGQGFYLARPAAPFPRVRPSVKQTILGMARPARHEAPVQAMTRSGVINDEDGEEESGEMTPPFDVSHLGQGRARTVPLDDDNSDFNEKTQPLLRALRPASSMAPPLVEEATLPPLPEPPGAAGGLGDELGGLGGGTPLLHSLQRTQPQAAADGFEDESTGGGRPVN